MGASDRTKRMPAADTSAIAGLDPTVTSVVAWRAVWRLTRPAERGRRSWARRNARAVARGKGAIVSRSAGARCSRDSRRASASRASLHQADLGSELTSRDPGFKLGMSRAGFDGGPSLLSRMTPQPPPSQIEEGGRCRARRSYPDVSSDVVALCRSFAYVAAMAYLRRGSVRSRRAVAPCRVRQLGAVGGDCPFVLHQAQVALHLANREGDLL